MQKGLLYSHMGWMVLKQDPQRIGRVDITDLNNDPVVMWQHRNFVTIALSMSFLFPCVVAGLGWGDWKGGLIYAGILRLLVRIFLTSNLTDLGSDPLSFDPPVPRIRNDA